MENEMTTKESQDAGNSLSDEIYDWAKKRVGEDSACTVMLQIRGLARKAAKVKGMGSHPYVTQEEFNNFKKEILNFYESNF